MKQRFPYLNKTVKITLSRGFGSNHRTIVHEGRVIDFSSTQILMHSVGSKKPIWVRRLMKWDRIEVLPDNKV